jgi:enoyl-CoA hydratase/carnithine racemase
MARIELSKRGPIGEIRLNRPEILNALGAEWPTEMLAAAHEMQDDPAIRVVLVTGEGRAFCSGLDLTQLASGAIPNQFFHEAEYAFRALETMDKAVICGIQGYCLGGGLQIAIACDVRIATDDAILGLPAVQEAFLPGMGTYRLPRVIGMGWARHLILSGENVDAEEAYRIGLVNKVVPRADLMDETMAFARRIAQNDPFALRMAKLSVNQAQDEMGYSTFIRSALQTYMVTSESGAKELKDGGETARRRFATVDRALAYERERATGST